MSTIKEENIQALSNLPGDASTEDMMYRLYVLDCIRRGEKDIAEGKVLSQHELEKQSEKLWL